MKLPGNPTTDTFNSARTKSTERAAKAAHSVDHLFGSRAWHVPGTYLGAVAFPHPSRGPWHYWWQAHLMDALVDAAIRERTAGHEQSASQLRARAHQLLRGMAVRSGGRVTHNLFFDDMAWLTLALGRLRHEDIKASGRTPRSLLDAAGGLFHRLGAACDANLGGGAWWNTTRDFKNTASTAPIALAFLRAHRVEQGRDLVSWLFDTLWDTQDQVFFDGIRLIAAGSGTETTALDKRVFSYNCGPVLGACVELAERAQDPQERELWVARAQAIIQGVAQRFTQDGPHGQPVLTTHGSGDGSLFSGILARYLTEAASSALIPAPERDMARGLVSATADALWEGRREFDPAIDFSKPGVDPSTVDGETVAIFSPDPAQHANQAQPVGAPVELGTQVQAWTILEAAARLALR